MSIHRLSCRIVCTLLFVAAFAPASALGQQKEQASANPESTADDAKAGADASGERLLEEAAEISGEVARIRGLSLKHEIKKGIRNRDQLRKVLIERLAEEVTDEDVENEAKVFKKLGLMPEDLDYKQTLLDVLTEQIAGFYDQNAKELYIMQGIPLELQRPAMAHEIFHAIQDQHFDIKRMVEPISSKENGDFALARSALIEGDASVVMIDFSLYEEGVLPRDQVRSIIDIPMMANVLTQLTREDIGALQQMVPQGTNPSSPVDPSQLSESALADAPRMIRKLLVFPYFGGMRFVIKTRLGHDWERVNQVYKNPPVSTEQILHPERYFAGDEPVRLDYNVEPTFEDDALIYDSVLGEYQMRLVLEEHLLEGEDGQKNRAPLDKALDGWDGDRLRAYETSEGQTLISHLSVWDSLDDADEYFDALVEMMKVRYPDAKLTHNRGKYGQSVCMRAGEGDEAERIYLEQWGDLVLHLEGAPTKLDAKGKETDTTAYILRERIMRTVERTPFAEVYEQKVEAYDAEAATKDASDR
ncbi:hypothetical protein FIV42_04250 [Persicimonas caeni]|uniref:DUF4157 domain-containing protein n=1 Tax=Persicimonas caeni TaxID=2292766 RepID=A0A4Y6PNT0_PERCE|nr:hypothetical protein [Persicimonas caeni]QDG49978.1 hypothetical protein FIV42_04250 [Persicimonas caeni]QED31199.1 hypothetical protein FRD00_04245 [Persicimonas caeni]